MLRLPRKKLLLTYRSVDLQDLPPIVTRRIPLVGGYKFVKLEDRILLVDPADRAVVAQIPRYKLIN